MSTIPDEFAAATELGPAYHRCDPAEPLRGEALNHWHVDLCEERGVRGFVERLVRRISAAGGQERSPGGRPYEHVLLSGHTGSGKSGITATRKAIPSTTLVAS